MIIQFCGLSGSGKSTLAVAVKKMLLNKGIAVEIIDGDEYRRELCADLGFSKKDRNENIRRLAFVASRFSAHRIVTIICAINPYQEIREEIAGKYSNVKTVFIDCSIEVLQSRDTKELYARANLPQDHPDHVPNLSGVNDPFEVPEHPDLVIETTHESMEYSAQKLYQFVLGCIS